MSVYIKGMEMPTHCIDCPFMVSRDNDDCILQSAEANENFENWEQMKAGCPLIPVPEHGDLIERNKLYEKTAEWEAQALHMVEVTMHDEDTTEWRKWSTVLTERSAFKFDVADAPTIIPEDKEGEG